MNTSFSTGPVVVGIDGSETALDAVRFAVQEARGRGTSLRLVHVTDRHSTPETVYGAPDVDADYARAALSFAADVAAAINPAIAVESVALHGRPESVMSTEAGCASLLVLGTTTDSAVAAWVLGSMVGALVESSPRPVAIVRHFDARAGGPVVAALGDIEVSSTDVVVTQAFREASIRGASVLAVHTQSVSSILTAALSGPDDGLHPESAMDVRLEHFGTDYPDVRVASVYAEADSGSELVAISETAQLMVVGHERDRVPGRTLTAILRHAHCPVLVVPHA